MKKNKPIQIWPGDKRLLDGTQDIVYMGPVIYTSLFFFIIGYGGFFSLFWIVFGTHQKGLVSHLWGTIQLQLGGLFSFLQTDFYYSYVRHMLSEIEQGNIRRVMFNMSILVSWIGGLLGAVLGFKYAYVPMSQTKHHRGMRLVEDREVYEELHREFSMLESSGLLLGRYEGMNPNDPKLYNPKTRPKDLIELPEDRRRTHFIYVAGSGRGKTHTIYTHQVVPIYNHIRQGTLPYKLLIVDTPKSDYSKAFYEKHMVRIAPHEQGAKCWDIAKDLNHSLKAEAFWEGVIPDSDGDKIWGIAARQVGAGTTTTLINLAPGQWTYGMQAQLLSRNPMFLKMLLNEHYIEAKQVLDSAETTLTSVMFNLGAYTSSFIQLARIYDGYDYKREIKQATAKALKIPEYLEYIFAEMCFDEDEADMPEDLKKTMAIMFNGITREMNKNQPEWKWKEYAEFLKSKTLEDLIRIADKNVEAGLIKLEEKNMGGFIKICSTIIARHELWDEIESRGRFSVREWIINDEVKKRILVLKPSETYPTLTEPLIRGMLYYINRVILGEVKDDPKRKFQIIIDELQSNGNIDPFLGPALALYRSKGIGMTLAFQDLSQLNKLYGEEFVQFLNSNTTNIFVLGVNQGTTATSLSEMLGERTILKLHQSQSFSEGGKSTSQDWQEHQVKVMTPDEVNSKLGVKREFAEIHYLYLGGGMKNAYILRNKLVSYKSRSESKPASWITEPPPKKSYEDIQAVWRANAYKEMKKVDKTLSFIDELEEDLDNNLTDNKYKDVIN